MAEKVDKIDVVDTRLVFQEPDINYRGVYEADWAGFKLKCYNKGGHPGVVLVDGKSMWVCVVE
jgi:hypothetical protein